MNKNRDKNYYELLSIAQDASAEEVENAYQNARALYGEDSVAVYSLYSQDEREAMLKGVIEAYATLKNSAKRTAYDASLKLSENKNNRGASKPDKSKLSLVKKSFQIGRPETVTGIKSPLAVMKENEPVVAEQYRVLYTKIDQISEKSSLNSFAFTSAVQQEGKTTTAFNLAYLMGAEFRKRVILVECDMKRPSFISEYLDKTPKYDLVNVILEEVELKDAITQVEGSDLHVLPVKQPVRRSSEFLSSQKMKDILAELKAEYDYVLLDCPPILSLADVNLLTKIVDGFVMVVRAGKTPKDIVQKAVSSLSGANIVGIVLNNSSTDMAKYYYYSS